MLIGKVVRALREGLGLTQEEMAKKLHISGPFLSMLEAGRRFPTVRYQNDMYWRLANLAGSHRSQKAIRDLYAYLIAVDFQTREPMVYQLLGEHFSVQFQQEQKQVATEDRSRSKIARPRNVRLSKAVNE